MRKLSTLVLLAFLAAPALSLAATGPADTAPKTNVVWITLGNTPMAVEAAPAAHLVTICYYGVTMMVSEKIAKRYLRIGARCGSCDMQDEQWSAGQTLSNVGSAPPSGVCEQYNPCKEVNSVVCNTSTSVVAPPASKEKLVQIGK